jgi:hypothetical protein
MSILLAFVALGCVALIWQSAMRSRDLANRAAREACERGEVQLLDGTVAFRKLAFARGGDGRLGLRRTYVFDYSDDGYSRRQGFVIVRGTELEVVGLGPTLVH